MTVTAFDIYLVMQIDSLLTIAGAVGFVGTAASIVTLICVHVTGSTDSIDLRLANIAKKALPICAPLLLLAIACPSGKTLAAMKVIPAIVNNESVQGEAKELYDLAKQGLKELVSDKKAE